MTFGGLITVQSLDDLAMAVLGLLTLLLGLGSLVQAGRRASSGRGTSARLCVDADGTTTTSVDAAASSLALPLAALAVVTLASLAWAWAAWQAENPVTGTLLVLCGAVSAVPLVVPLVRGPRPDRVDLSPTSITTEHFGRRAVVRWEDVYGCVPPLAPAQPMALVLRAGAGPEVTARTWPMWQRSKVPENVEPVAVQDLRVRPDLLARVVALCADDPTLRAALGTEASLDWSRWPAGPREPRP